MTKHAESAGITLIELMVVIGIAAVLIAIAGPQIFKTLQSESRVKSAARELIADLKTAQNEAVRRGGGDMTAGKLVRKSVFVVFDAAAGSYSVFAYADANSNGARDTGESTPITPSRSLSNSVHFGTLASVNWTACTNNANTAPASPVGPGFTIQAEAPCYNKPCVELNANGFPITTGSTLTTDDRTLYVTNDKDAYAVNMNSAGLLTLCKWSGTKWAIVR